MRWSCRCTAWCRYNITECYFGHLTEKLTWILCRNLKTFDADGPRYYSHPEERSDWWLPNIWLWANQLSSTPYLLPSEFKSMHNFIYVVPPNSSIARKQKTDSPVRAIMNVMFGYCRMLLSEAPYWGSSTWVRTKGAKVAWWSTSPPSWAWQPLQVLLFMLPRSMQSSDLLALSE